MFSFENIAQSPHRFKLIAATKDSLACLELICDGLHLMLNDLEHSCLLDIFHTVLGVAVFKTLSSF